MSRLLALLAALLAARLSGQQTAVPVHYRLLAVELSILPDTAYGLQLIASPSVGSREKSARLVWLRLHPDSVLEWLNRAAAALQLPASGGPVNAMQWSPDLRPLDGRGGLLIGRHRKKGVLQKDYGLAAADSAPGWEVEITGSEADSVLRLLLAAAAVSRVDTSNRAAADEGRVDQPAKLLQQERPRSRGAAAVVALRYVVGLDGRAEPGSLQTLFASAPENESEAARLVLDARFAAALKSGRPVRQLMRQVIVWP